MTLNDPLANAMSLILNAERIGRTECTIRPVSKIISKVLDVMQSEGFLGSHTLVKDGRGDYFEVNLLGAINKCGVIKPRYPVKADGFEKFEKRYLPAKDFGVLIVTTPQGIFIHKDVKKNQTGGRLLAYCY